MAKRAKQNFAGNGCGSFATPTVLSHMTLLVFLLSSDFGIFEVII